MATDEEILLKVTRLLENFDISEQKTKKVLREITEDEMRVVEDVLDDLEPAILPLNNLFGGKMRVVIPFPTMDTESDLGKFAKMLDQELELQVYWEKGIVSAQREFTENSIENDKNFVGSLLDRGVPQKKVNKKFQMKIGKYFMKLDKLLRDYKEMRQIIAEKVYGESNMSANWMARFSVGQIKDAFTTDQLKRYYQIMNGLELYAGTDSMGGISKYYGSYEEAQAGNVTKFTEFAKYWQKNAGYIKDEIGNLTNDKYSIIITRHPIDVLRMSDFDNITSCHSPASRTSAYQSYYKCAVAEAQGHGAVAYVVETEDLLSETNTGNIDSAEQEIQEGEIFFDARRPMDTVLDITPVSRARIRHVRYYDTDAPKRYDDGIDVGVPETRIYGAGIPGILDTVTSWARENQQEVIENMPKEDNVIDLDKFIIFGGSYEDTAGYHGRLKLMRQLVGPDVEVEGSMKQNTDTEDNLDANLIGDVMAQYEGECEIIRDRYNQRMANCFVDYEVDDDGDGGIYINITAKIKLEWQLSDWKSLPNAHTPSVMHSPSAINDIYGDLLDENGPYLNKRGEIVEWHCDINLGHPDLGGQGYAIDPEQFDDICSYVDTVIDDKRDAFNEILSNYFRREGFIQGGVFLDLSMAIDDRDITSYEWDLETDGDYDDSYEAYASYSFDYDLENFKMDADVLKDILNSRDYKIQLRRNLLQQPQKVVDTDYFLSMKVFANKYVEGEVRVTVTFSVNRDEPDDMSKLFHELVEGDMDDEDNLTIIFNKTLAQIKALIGSGQWPEQESSATANISENLVRIWKNYLIT